ncbi:hypothetical protein WME94_35305 [Sorangium sp. So ce429]
MCAIPFPDDGSPELRAARGHPLQMSARITQAFVDFLRAECAAHTVLLVLEDMHWGDALTARLADAALAELCEQPLMVLALARPELAELFPGLWAQRRRQTLELRGLNQRACERLVLQVLGPQLASAHMGRIVEQAAGNALYLEELIRAAAEGNLEELPGALMAMLQGRLLRLDAGARSILLAASVFGETFCKGETISTRKNNIELFRRVASFVRQRPPRSRKGSEHSHLTAPSASRAPLGRSFANRKPTRACPSAGPGWGDTCAGCPRLGAPMPDGAGAEPGPQRSSSARRRRTWRRSRQRSRGGEVLRAASAERARDGEVLEQRARGRVEVTEWA